ncbi:hypothetical protein ALP76_02289 [Pseudomonas savastanoi pv. glycinea]|nr:hypothetical protein [Pseudomonas savastanoi pv. phaseolicola]RMR85571.1 hypothetical protein ALP76_02289 [Pseudomonas savastanoi pv. glycinea]
MADQNPNEQEQKHLYVVPNMGGNKSVNTSITGPESNTGGGIEVKVSPQHTGAPDATHGSRTRQGGDWSFGFNSGTGGGFNGGLSGALVAQVVKEPKNAPALALKPDQKLRLRPSGKRKNTRPTSQE